MPGDPNSDKSHVTRRNFLTKAGGAAAAMVTAPEAIRALAGRAAAAEPVAAPAAVASAAPAVFHGAPVVLGRAALPGAAHTRAAALAATSPMGRMFPALPPHTPTQAALEGLAAILSDPGGSGFDNPAIPAGFTFLGQFIDHDLTFDQVSDLLGSNDPNVLNSSRSAKFDLDSMYGDGPAASPQLYDPADPAKLLLVTNANGVRDLPRNADQSAVIADPRNDEQRIISQVHMAFIRFHNALVDLQRSRGTAEDRLLSVAQSQARNHFQWVVVHDFLPRIAGQDIVDSILFADPDGFIRVHNQFFLPGRNVFMPVEWSVAAYRFGHSMLRQAYTLRDGVGAVQILGPVDANNNLNGGRNLTADTEIQWHNFYDIPGDVTIPQRSRKIDAGLSAPLFALPPQSVEDHPEIGSLALRNLMRGVSFGLPSGQAVASAMGIAPLTNAALGLTDPGFNGGAPLWFYVLKEAELLRAGERLGPVGGRIVAEVILGAMRLDRQTSYLGKGRPSFVPRAPIAPATGVFAMGDLLRFAGAA